jgi:hypothetical protein
MSGQGIGIIAGGGGLPPALAEALPDATCIAFDGAEVQIPEPRLSRHRVEHLGGLFEALRTANVTQVVMAGAMSRPALDPSALDPVMMALAPRILMAMQGGDDALLRLVIAIFEEQGFTVIGAHELLPDLTAAPGLVTGPEPDDSARADMARGQDILTALGPVDVGQGCVVAGGLCLGVETLQGTDALLRFVADTPAQLRPKPGGVLVKRPKPGQDLRVDMPAIGPETVRGAQAAGLSGIAIAAGQVLLIDRPALLQALKDTGLYLIAEPA